MTEVIVEVDGGEEKAKEIVAQIHDMKGGRAYTFRFSGQASFNRYITWLSDLLGQEDHIRIIQKFE